MNSLSVLPNTFEWCYIKKRRFWTNSMEFRTEKKSICLKSSLGKQTVEGEKELNRVENKKKNILLAIIMCSLVVFLV